MDADRCLFIQRNKMASTVFFGMLLAASSTWAVHATELPVSNCLDDGSPGSLRSVVAGASNSDLVNLSGLACNTIVLSSGEIPVALANLAVTGAGSSLISIDAGHVSRVFDHTGGGTLTLTGMTVRNGSFTSANEARGGCIYSSGSVTLDNMIVSNCSVSSDLLASGGGIFSALKLTMDKSVISNSSAIKTGGGGVPVPSAQGGGATAGSVEARVSTISGNAAVDSPNERSRGGGLDIDGSVFIRRCTIDHNSASYGGGLSNMASTTDIIFRSTISNNVATIAGGGIYGRGDFNVSQSTVAFNTGSLAGAGGIQNSRDNYGIVVLRSSIVANNGPAENNGADVSADNMNFTLSADYSLVMRTEATILGSVLTSDPLLAPLADNGGPTRTHALMPGSPALQAGWNDYTHCDQRLFPRWIDGDADIGAFEDPGEHLFWGAFEDCI